MIQIAILLPVLAAVGGGPSPEVERSFQSLEFKYVSGKDGEKIYHYRLFAPELGQGVKAPLVVWLHGYGNDEFALFNRGQLLHTQLIFSSPEECKRQKFFLLAMQCPRPPGTWYKNSGKPSADEPMTALRALIDKLVTELPIDNDRISLIGISAGGTSAWEMAIRYPELFAAVAPLGSTGRSSSLFDRLQKIPIWAFHSSGDHSAPIHRSIEHLNAVGGSAYLTEIAQEQHDCWTQALTKYDLLQWLIAQRRNGWRWWPPGYRSPWQLAMQICIPMLVIGACVREILRRKRNSQIIARKKLMCPGCETSF